MIDDSARFKSLGRNFAFIGLLWLLPGPADADDRCICKARNGCDALIEAGCDRLRAQLTVDRKGILGEKFGHGCGDILDCPRYNFSSLRLHFDINIRREANFCDFNLLNRGSDAVPFIISR